MSTPKEIMEMSAALLNDSAQERYTNAAQLPYLNMALDELQELFEWNNIPATNEVSAVINISAAANPGVTAIGYETTPALPTGLIEIQQLWESPEGQNGWTPMTKKDFLPHYLEAQLVGKFLIFAWEFQEIRLLNANVDIDLKIDYIRNLFVTPIPMAAIETDLKVRNIKMFLGYRTGGLCAEFIAENKERADSLNEFAELALDRELGIPIKGRQAISTRRRPFQAAHKSRGVW